jgi:hypothetical protein
MSDVVGLRLRAEERRMQGHAKRRRRRRGGSADKRCRFRDERSEGKYIHALFQLEEVDSLVDSRVPQVCGSNEVLERIKCLGSVNVGARWNRQGGELLRVG